MASLNVKLTEFGVSIVLLAIFIVLFALAEDIAGPWYNVAYILIIAGFTVVLSYFGMKMAPYLY